MQYLYSKQLLNFHIQVIAVQNEKIRIYNNSHIKFKLQCQNIKMKEVQMRKQSRKQVSKLSRSMQSKNQYIYNGLIKLGCPLIKVTVYEYEESLSQFMQASDSRLDLIEWLLAIIYPGYNLDSEYKNSYEDDAHVHKIKRYSITLWQIGVMPVTKHTKNLDYHKYVQGLLGYQSAVNLIYDLVELAEAKFSANISKIQQVATDLLKQLIQHNEQLVNINYDPYGVSFPPKYNQDTEQSANKLNELFNSIVQNLNESAHNENDQKQNKKECEVQQLLSEADGYKQLFKRKYQKLCQAMEKIANQYNNILPISDKKQVTQLHKRRVLNISKDLCNNYRNYHKLITSIKQQEFKHQEFTQLKNNVLTFISQINQVTNIYQ